MIIRLKRQRGFYRETCYYSQGISQFSDTRLSHLSKTTLPVPQEVMFLRKLFIQSQTQILEVKTGYLSKQIVNLNTLEEFESWQDLTIQMIFI